MCLGLSNDLLFQSPRFYFSGHSESFLRSCYCGGILFNPVRSAFVSVEFAHLNFCYVPTCRIILQPFISVPLLLYCSVFGDFPGTVLLRRGNFRSYVVQIPNSTVSACLSPRPYSNSDLPVSMSFGMASLEIFLSEFYRHGSL
jgi:hypothetical protein